MSLETEVRIDIVSNNEEYLSVNIKKKKGNVHVEVLFILISKMYNCSYSLVKGVTPTSPSTTPSPPQKK